MQALNGMFLVLIEIKAYAI